MPIPVMPMLCERQGNIQPKQLSYPRWIFEPKLDGERIIAIKTGQKVEMWTRRGKEVSKKFPEVSNELRDSSGDWILDGELVVVGGFTNLLKRNVDDAMTARILSAKLPATLVIFDVLVSWGKDVRGLALMGRKQELSTFREKPHLKIIQYSTGDPDEALQGFWDAGYEGMVAKRSESIYQPDRRSPDWVKFKKIETVDVEVVGTTVSPAGQPFGALILLRDGRYYGKVGTGFTDAERVRVKAMLEPKGMPIVPYNSYGIPSDVMREASFFCFPVPCEIRVQEHFKDGTPRHPVFVRWRLT